MPSLVNACHTEAGYAPHPQFYILRQDMSSFFLKTKNLRPKDSGPVCNTWETAELTADPEQVAPWTTSQLMHCLEKNIKQWFR